MTIINKKYPYFSEDENGKWKHYNTTFKALIEPSEEYIVNNPVILLKNENNEKLQKENEDLKEKVSYLEKQIAEILTKLN